MTVPDPLVIAAAKGIWRYQNPEQSDAACDEMVAAGAYVQHAQAALSAAFAALTVENAREQAQEACRQLRDAVPDEPPTHDEYAAAASDVWEPLLAAAIHGRERAEDALKALVAQAEGAKPPSYWTYWRMMLDDQGRWLDERDELRSLLRELTDAIGGVTLTGARRVGKTRLAQAYNAAQAKIEAIDDRMRPRQRVLAWEAPMSAAGDTRIEWACRLMHDAYETAAVRQGWETQEASRKDWDDVPEANKQTMRAAVAALLDAIDADRLHGSHTMDGTREYAREVALRKARLMKISERFAIAAHAADSTSDVWEPLLEDAIRGKERAGEALKTVAAQVDGMKREIARLKAERAAEAEARRRMGGAHE